MFDRDDFAETADRIVLLIVVGLVSFLASRVIAAPLKPA